MIPNRPAVLNVLRRMDRQPILMLGSDEHDYGARWTLDGQEIEPAIARYLMEEGYVAAMGVTDMGARIFGLTPSGRAFRQDGIVWWSGLRLLQKLKAILSG